MPISIITLLNSEKVDTKNDNFVSIKGDATNLSEFKDQEFDIVFSNSVIEHLFSKENQRKWPLKPCGWANITM